MRIIKIVGLTLAGLFLLIQIIPSHLPDTPDPGPHTLEPSGSTTPEVIALLQRACYDCHSTQTRYPWYSHVAPVSWLVISDVNEGRDKLNFSEWNSMPKRRQFHKLGDIKEQIEKGEMPLGIYLVMHHSARLSATERQALVDWTESASHELMSR